MGELYALSITANRRKKKKKVILPFCPKGLYISRRYIENFLQVPFVSLGHEWI